MEQGTEGRSLLVDARGIAQSGIGRSLREVLKRLVEDPRFPRVTLLGRPGEIREFEEEAWGRRRVRVLSFPHHFYAPAGQAHWLFLAARGALRHDAAFFPHYDVPLPGPPPCSVVMVHDLAHFSLPYFPRWKVALAGTILDRAVQRATRILVPSRTTEAAVSARFPQAASRIRTIVGGVGPEWALPPVVPPSTEPLRPYLLCVGNRKPHKNFATAVEVLARLRRTRPELRLVIAGRGNEDVDQVRERARACGVDEAVVELGGVPDERLRALYAGAECLLFPSLYEGWGLPVLEAMAAGAPVVASNRASLPEAVGDAGVLADPADAGAMAAAVERMWHEPAFREELVRRGRARAARFRWDDTAAATVDLLWEVANAGRCVPEPWISAKATAAHG